MWILPNNYRPSSRSVPDTLDSKQDLTSPALNIESSLMWKSKPTPLRTWLAKWKQDSWIRRLYGRILKPSQWACFEEQWTYLLQDIRVSRFLQRAAAGDTRTLDTYGPTLARLSGSYDPDAFSLRMWTATLVSDLTKSSPTWRRMVTERRGAYSRRARLAAGTSVNGYISWPTPRASEYKDCGPVGSKSHIHMYNRRYLCAWVKREDMPAGKLDPYWTEWLMGLRSGWTSLDEISTDHYGWQAEPDILRVTDSCPDRVDRIHLLGNGVVPQTAAVAWETLSKELET
jgi:hypothetical protein